jgi:hypothetical protein
LTFDGKIGRTDGLIEQAGEFDGIQYFFSTFQVATFHMFLYQPQRADEEMAENEDNAYEIQGKSRPKATVKIRHDTQYHQGNAQIKAVTDKPGIKLHNFFLGVAKIGGMCRCGTLT